MLTIFEQPSPNNFNINNRGGIKRLKKMDGPTNFYQQIEYNAERLLINFPQKDKLWLMKLLEDLDNQVEVAHEILNSENSQQCNSNFPSKNSQFNQNSYSDFEMSNQFNNSNNRNNQMNQDQNKFIASKDVLEKRRIVSNLKPKMIKKDGLGVNQGQKLNQQQNGVSVGLQQMQSQQQSINGNGMNYNCIQMEENINDRQSGQFMQTRTSTSQQDNLQKLNKNQLANQDLHKNEDDDQQSASQEEEQQSHTQQMKQQYQEQNLQQQQQGPVINRIKDIGQISEFQKQLVENIIPQLLSELTNSNVQSAPEILMQAFKWYEGENQKVIQYDQILSKNQLLLKTFSNQRKKNSTLEKQNIELTQENSQLKNEKEQYRNTAERLQIMFNTNNQQKQNVFNDHFDKGGNGRMCY